LCLSVFRIDLSTIFVVHLIELLVKVLSDIILIYLRKNFVGFVVSLHHDLSKVVLRCLRGHLHVWINIKHLFLKTFFHLGFFGLNEIKFRNQSKLRLIDHLLLDHAFLFLRLWLSHFNDLDLLWDNGLR
jgi:hypothetical protein